MATPKRITLGSGKLYLIPYVDILPYGFYNGL